MPEPSDSDARLHDQHVKILRGETEKPSCPVSRRLLGCSVRDALGLEPAPEMRDAVSTPTDYVARTRPSIPSRLIHHYQRPRVAPSSPTRRRERSTGSQAKFPLRAPGVPIATAFP